jgi:adenosine deaminase
MKTELHRHLGGSISCQTISKVSNVNLDEVIKYTTYAKNEPKNYEAFFNKFKILDSVVWDLDKIDLTIKDVIWGLKKESIEYAEIKFSINKYIKDLKCSKKDLIILITYKFEQYASQWGIDIDPILSLKHGMDPQEMIEISDLIKDDDISECVSGIDIVGNENYFNLELYKKIFKLWNEAGKTCMLHVGEIYNPENVKKSIYDLKVDRICHGIAVADDKELAKYTKDNLISFDICPTSNILTGVAPIDDHPVSRMIENGFIITIGTDDPVVFNTNLNNEYELLKKIANLNENDLDIIKNSAYYLSSKEITKRKQK